MMYSINIRIKEISVTVDAICLHNPEDCVGSSKASSSFHCILPIGDLSGDTRSAIGRELTNIGQ
jgi:hypothetical protein